jgi:hypothetical protein
MFVDFNIISIKKNKKIEICNFVIKVRELKKVYKHTNFQDNISIIRIYSNFLMSFDTF